MSIENDLFKKLPDEYGDVYQAHFFEQYKLYVESADRISQRRQSANNFFLSLNTALFAVLGGILSRSSQLSERLWLLPVTIIGVILCYVWSRLVSSYKGLNATKFEVIHVIEKRLPVALFNVEQKQTDKEKNYKSFSDIEKWVPKIFGVLYIVLLLIG